MKILYLTNLPSPYRVEFFNELVRCGIDVTVLFERKNAENREEKWISEEKFLFHGIYLKSLKIGNENALALDAIKYIKKNDYDLIIIGGYSTITSMFCIEYMKIKKIPFVINADGGIISQDSWFKKKLKEHFIGSALAWLSSSPITTNYLVHYGAKHENVYEFPFSSIKKDDIEEPLNEIKKKELREKLHLSEEKTILYVGQFIYRKGIDVLLDSVRKMQSVKTNVLLVGGNATEELKKIVNDYNLKNIHFLPFKSKNDLKFFYKVADAFVLPTRYDIWGLVVNEAIGYGLPVVSTDRRVAAQTMIKSGENGFICNSENSDELASKMSLLLNNEAMRNAFAKKNIEIAKKYTIESMAKRHLEIFNKILDG
jgi:glycosyltransferase involved in cell wall biosynthesis